MTLKHRILSLRDFKALDLKAGHSSDPIIIPKTFATTVEALGKALGDPDDSRELKFILSTASVDREGDTIDPKGWKLEEFKTAGVVLFGHNSYEPPIAAPTGVEIDGDKLVGTAKFPTREEYEFGNLIYRLYRIGIMKAVSVGFMPLKYQINEERPSTGWGPAIDFIEQALIEWSCVPVPANAEALHLGGKGLDLRPLLNYTERFLDGDAHPELAAVVRGDFEALHKALTDDRLLLVMPGEDGAAEEPPVATAEAPEPATAAAQAPVAPEAAPVAKPAASETAAATPAGPHGLPTLAEDPTAHVQGVLELAAMIATMRKAGRVLSAANESKLRQASDLLDEVLVQVESDDEEDDAKGLELNDDLVAALKLGVREEIERQFRIAAGAPD